MEKRENIWNVPNILTMVRMALIGVFIWQFVLGHRYWALAIFLGANLTDFLDGYIARKYQLITNFGKLMDPLADKLMLITALSCLTISGLVPYWITIIIFVKECIMVVGGFFLLRKGIVMQAQLIGKAATVVFLVAVVVTFLDAYTNPWDLYLQYFAAALSVSAMVWYGVQAVQMLQKQK